MTHRRPKSSSSRNGRFRMWAVLRIAPTAAALMLLIGAFILDCVSGDEVSSSLFYVVGIAVAAWFVGQSTGLLIACLSAVAWATAVHFVGPSFSKASVFYWNLGVEFAVYLITAVAFDRVHRLLLQERRLSEQLNLVKGALDRETQAVGELQREMLPPALPEVPGYEWQAYYTASSNAGGDYYDFFLLSDGRIAFLVGDASGHGAQAAVLMAMMRVLLHTTSEALTPPDRVLARLGDQIAQTVPLGRFATACYAVLEPSSGRIEFSLAGHPPPLILRGDDGAPDELPLLGGPPLGLLPGSAFEAGATSIRPGDTLILYTDGLTESTSPARELFGVDRLREALRCAGALPLVELRDRILARLDAHTAGTALEDDLTLLMLRRTPQLSLHDEECGRCGGESWRSITTGDLRKSR
jgi:serine phosphatase RsbU (regulator of sigma subunit)